jgi:hypothetical protein
MAYRFKNRFNVDVAGATLINLGLIALKPLNETSLIKPHGFVHT